VAMAEAVTFLVASIPIQVVTAEAVVVAVAVVTEVTVVVSPVITKRNKK